LYTRVETRATEGLKHRARRVSKSLSMAPLRALHLAQLVLGVHALVALFVVFGMSVVPVGAAQRWTFVRGFSFRAVHLGIVLIIALQKVLGATCFLSVWEFELLDAAGGAATRMPALQAFTNAPPLERSNSSTPESSKVPVGEPP